MSDITLQQAGHDLLTLHRHRVTLEGFYKLLEGRESVDGLTAQAMSIALEDSDTPTDKQEGITGKDLVAGIKKAGVTIRRIIQWLLRTVGELIEKLGLGMQKLGRKGQNVKDKAAHMSEEEKSTMAKTEIEPKTFDALALVINGEFVGNDPEQINNVIKMGDYINVDFPNMFSKIVTATETLAKKHANDDNPGEFLSALSTVLQQSLVGPKIQSSERDGNGTVPLPGGREYQWPDARNAVDITENTGAFSNYFIFKFDVDGEAPNLVGQVPPLQYDAVTKLANMVNDALEKGKDTKATGNTIQSSARKIESLVREIESSNAAAATTILTVLGLMLQRFTTTYSSLQSWYVRTLSQELNYLDICLGSQE